MKKNNKKIKENKALMKQYFLVKDEITTIYKNIIVISEQKIDETNKLVAKIDEIQKNWNKWYAKTLKRIDVLNEKMINIEKKIK